MSSFTVVLGDLIYLRTDIVPNISVGLCATRRCIGANLSIRSAE